MFSEKIRHIRQNAAETEEKRRMENRRVLAAAFLCLWEERREIGRKDGNGKQAVRHMIKL